MRMDKPFLSQGLFPTSKKMDLTLAVYSCNPCTWEVEAEQFQV